MKPATFIQQANLDTHPAALALLQAFFQEEGFDTPLHLLDGRLQTMIANPRCAVFLAWQNERAVAVATVTTSYGLEYGPSAEIEDLYVLPGSRNQGIANQLIETACAWCLNNQINIVLVTVTPEGNTKHQLLNYYQQHGFTNTKRTILERLIIDEE